VHKCRTKQHKAVLIIFPLILQTSSDAVYWRGGGPEPMINLALKTSLEAPITKLWR